MRQITTNSTGNPAAAATAEGSPIGFPGPDDTRSPLDALVREGARKMLQTVEAVVDATGRVRLLGEIQIAGPRRALVTVLEEPAEISGEATLLSEAALAADWSRPEEDVAWSHCSP